jgi:hypothetical protein
VAPLATYLQDPLNTYLHEYGVVDGLRSSGVLSPAEVPLALAYWTGTDGIKFVDMWSVRRRMIGHSAAGGLFPLITDRKTAEAEAMFLQFQDQVADLFAVEANLSDMRATDKFEFLPPVGIIPLGGMASSKGFDSIGFFAGLSYREKPAFLEGARLRSLVIDALAFPPIDLSRKELIWRYLVRENFQAIDNAKSNPPQPCLILANGQMPFRAAARYDLAHWNYANFS